MSREKIIDVMAEGLIFFENGATAAEAALTALEAAGYAIVPVEPTEKMLHQGEGMTDLVLPPGFDNTVKARQDEIRTAWQAMLQAAKGE
jgi:hypothetical protein